MTDSSFAMQLGHFDYVEVPLLTTFLRRVIRPLLVLVPLLAMTTALFAAPPAAVTVSISPTTATLTPGGSRTFTATVSGTSNTAVTWTYSGGSIQGTGATVTYTAPATLGTYTLTATSVASTTKKATATVTVAAPGRTPYITISPAFASVGGNGTATFTASLTGLANPKVLWRVLSGRGAVSPTGVYSAPALYAPCGQVLYAAPETLEAYSEADPSVKCQVVVTVQPPSTSGIKVNVLAPPKVDFIEGETGTFSASATGGSDARVEWESVSGPCFTPGYDGGNNDGSISVLGAFTAVMNSINTNQEDGRRDVLLRAKSLQDPSQVTFLQVRVWRRGSVMVSPRWWSFEGTGATPVPAGGTYQMSAEVRGGGAVVWSLPEQVGSISSSGLFTAPSSPLTNYGAVVRATNASDPNSYIETSILFVEKGDVTLTGTKWVVGVGGSLTFSASTYGTKDTVLWSLDPPTGLGTVTAKGVYTAPSSLPAGSKFEYVTLRATNAKIPSKAAEDRIRIDAPLSPGVLSVTTSSWPDSTWNAAYDNTGPGAGGYDRTRDPLSFWSITGNGTLLGAWYDQTYGYPCVKFKTGAPGTLTLTAHPSNAYGSLLVSKTVQVVPLPDLSGVYSNGTNAMRVLDFGSKTVIRPDGQSASMHRLWSTWSYLSAGTWKGLAWRGRKLVGPGLASIYSGYDAWSDAPDSRDRNFALDGLSLSDTAYQRTTDIIIGVEPADFVVDGSEGIGPSIVYLNVGQTLQLQAAVGGTANKGVTWSCPAGNGSVSSTGLYTAPATPGTYGVTATAQAAPNPSYALKIRVGTMDHAPLDKVTGFFSGTVTTVAGELPGPGTVKMFASGTDLAMEVDDPDPSTTTFVASIMGGIRGCSAYFNNGARALFEPQGDGTFLPQVEYSRQNGTRVAFGSAIRTNGVSIGILPRIDHLTDPILTGATRTFTAQVLGTTNTAVTWSAGNHDAYLAVAGNSVVFTGPPMPVGNIALDVTLRATSVADPTKFDAMTLRIKPVPMAAVTPATASQNVAIPGTSPYLDFTAAFPAQPSDDAFWSLEEGSTAGSISSYGRYSCGEIPGTYHVVATSQWDPSQKARATVTLSDWQPRIDGFRASPSKVKAGGNVTISWNSVIFYDETGTTVTLLIKDLQTGAATSVDVKGRLSFDHAPTHSTEYSLEAVTRHGTKATATSIVTVSPFAGWVNVWNPEPVRYAEACELTAWFSATQATLSYATSTGWGNEAWSQIGVVTPGAAFPIPGNDPMWAGVEYPLLKLEAIDAYGNQDTVQFRPPTAPKIMTFSSNPAGLLPGAAGSVTLSWSAYTMGQATTQLTLTALTAGGSTQTNLPASTRSIQLGISETTSYTLYLATARGADTKTLTVRVADVAALTLSPATVSLAPGATTTFTAALLAVAGKDGLSWTTTGGTLSGSGTSVTFQAPQAVGTYTVTVASVVDPSLTATATVTVLIGGPPGGGGGGSSTFEITSFTAGPSAQGADHRLLSWSTVGATGLSLRDSNGTESDVTGTTSLDVVPVGSTIYTLTATDGTSFISRTVAVAGAGYAIAVLPTKVALFANTTFKFSRTLYAPSNRVTWSCDGGTIAEDGTYTAPAKAGVYTVTATLVDDPTKTSTATVTVNEISLQIVPGYLSLVSTQSFGFGFEMFSQTGDTPTWSASAGVIQANGLFTAPLTPGLVTITLTSSKDTTKSATATVEVKPIDVMLFPSSLQLQPQGQYHFAAGTSLGGVTWSIVEAAGGSITSAGLYTAPGEVGSFTVRAKSNLDPTRVGTARVLVSTTGGDWGPGGGGGGTGSPVNNGVSVDPAMQSVDAGTYAALNATVLSSEDQRVTWEIMNNDPRAKVDDQGVFNAHEPGIYTVVATSVADATRKGTAILEVRSSVHGLEGIPVALDLEGYSVTVLKDGKVLIAGGMDTRVYDTDPAKGYRGTAYLYDPESKAFAQVGSLLQARADHTATLLNDGRVLIAGGIGYFKWPTDPDAQLEEQRVIWGEIYNPTTRAFEALPVNPASPNRPAGSSRSSHISGTSSLLTNGQVLIVSGISKAIAPYTLFDVFDPMTNLFDLTDIEQPVPGTGSSVESSQAYATREESSLVALEDGRALLTGGTHTYGFTETNPCGIGLCALTEARLFDPLTRMLSPIAGGMSQTRAGHTMTKLPNGKILIIGGADHFTIPVPLTYWPVPTATAEIFDPVAGTFTPTGSMKWPRIWHAAILLPTGQVMVMGGISSIVSDGAGGGIRYYPTDTEIYNPDTGTFELMDSLAFGLDRPKLALMKDGGVFVAGKPIITASAGTPAAGIQEKGSKSVRSVISPQFFTGSSMAQTNFIAGTTSPDTELNIEIENFISASTVSIPVSTNPLDYLSPDFWLSHIPPIMSFTGDGRTFTTIGDERFRTMQRVKFETNLKNRNSPIASEPVQRIGRTHQIYPIDKFGQAPISDLKVSGYIRTFTGEGVIEINGSTQNPLVPIAPSIDWKITVTIEPNGKKIRVTGWTDGFPSATIYVYRSNKKILYEWKFLEPSGPLGPLNLIDGIGDQPIDFSVFP